MSQTAEYITWRGMLDRCYKENSVGYKNYGGRGVVVCDRWNPAKGGSFENFYADMGSRPADDYQLDKEAVFANNKVYGPGLVKWTTRKENTRNRRCGIWTVYKGEKIHVAELANMFDIDRTLLAYHVKREGFSCDQLPAIISRLAKKKKRREEKFGRVSRSIS
jgi:hypothetical protein